MNTIQHNRQAVFLLQVHLVFVTKYRKKIFNKDMIRELNDSFNQICNKLEARLIEFNGEVDHVHLLVNYPPKVSISMLVNYLKGVSSRMLRKKYVKQIFKNIPRDALWSPSYFAGSCGGAPIEVLKQYIQQQQLPH